MAQGRKKIVEALKEKGFMYQDWLTGDGVHGKWRGASCRMSFTDVEVGENFVEAVTHLTDEGKRQFLWRKDEGRGTLKADDYLSELLECEMPWEEGR